MSTPRVSGGLTRGGAPLRHATPLGHDGPAWAPPRPSAPKPERSKPVAAATVVYTLSRARRLWSLLPVAALTATAGLGFHRVFEFSALVPVVAVAVLVPLALSAALSGILARRARRAQAPLWPSLLLTVVAWLVITSATLFRDAGGPLPTGTAIRAVWSALLDSPHAILSTILPVPADAELLILVHAVVWLATFTATELALRTRTAVLPAVPAVVAFAFPVVLGVGGPGSNTWYAAAMVAFTALLVLLRSRATGATASSRAGAGPQAPGRPAARAMAVGLPCLAVLALVAGLLGSRLPGLGSRAPYDPRQQVQPPTVRPESTSPLDLVSAWTQQPEAQLFTVRAAGVAPGNAKSGQVNWRLAVLDSYNGTKWNSAAKLARSGGRVPAEAGANPGKRQRIEQDVTVQSLPGVWLPAADRPSSITVPGGTEVFVDPDSGVVSTGQRAPAGFKYTAVSQLPVYNVERLQYAPAATAPAATELPTTDAAGQPIAAIQTFQELAAQATKGSGYAYQQAAKLADWLRANYKFDPTAVPGHAYRNLEFFLTEGKRGTSEQFAAAFAVLARTLGLPARVVVGFRSGTQTTTGTWQVTGSDVLAWPEVEFAGIGWVPFYPTPGKASKEGSSVAPAGQPKERKKVDQEIAAEPHPSVEPKPAGDDQAAPDAASGGGLPLWAYPLFVLLLLVIAYCGYAAWVPFRRRRLRRTASDHGQRVVGAWQQIIDRLVEIGLPPTRAHTAEEVAAFGSGRIGGAAGEHLPALAHLVNEVGYGGRHPDRQSADAAWQHCDAIEKLVVRSVPRRRRLGRALHPRSLRQRRQ